MVCCCLDSPARAGGEPQSTGTHPGTHGTAGAPPLGMHMRNEGEEEGGARRQNLRRPGPLSPSARLLRTAARAVSRPRNLPPRARGGVGCGMSSAERAPVPATGGQRSGECGRLLAAAVASPVPQLLVSLEPRGAPLGAAIPLPGRRAAVPAKLPQVSLRYLWQRGSAGESEAQPRGKPGERGRRGASSAIGARPAAAGALTYSPQPPHSPGGGGFGAPCGRPHSKQ